MSRSLHSSEMHGDTGVSKSYKQGVSGRYRGLKLNGQKHDIGFQKSKKVNERRLKERRNRNYSERVMEGITFVQRRYNNEAIDSSKRNLKESFPGDLRKYFGSVVVIGDSDVMSSGGTYNLQDLGYSIKLEPNSGLIQLLNYRKNENVLSGNNIRLGMAKYMLSKVDSKTLNLVRIEDSVAELNKNGGILEVSLYCSSTRDSSSFKEETSKEPKKSNHFTSQIGVAPIYTSSTENFGVYKKIKDDGRPISVLGF